MSKIACDIHGDTHETTVFNSNEWLSTTPLAQIDGLPEFGFRLPFDHVFTEPCKPFSMPRIHQLPSFVGLAYR